MALPDWTPPASFDNPQIAWEYAPRAGSSFCLLMFCGGGEHNAQRITGRADDADESALVAAMLAIRDEWARADAAGATELVREPGDSGYVMVRPRSVRRWPDDFR